MCWDSCPNLWISFPKSNCHFIVCLSRRLCESWNWKTLLVRLEKNPKSDKTWWIGQATLIIHPGNIKYLSKIFQYPWIKKFQQSKRINKENSLDKLRSRKQNKSKRRKKRWQRYLIIEKWARIRRFQQNPINYIKYLNLKV